MLQATSPANRSRQLTHSGCATGLGVLFSKMGMTSPGGPSSGALSDSHCKDWAEFANPSQIIPFPQRLQGRIERDFF